MVSKLIKYDFQSFIRLILPVQLIVIGIAALNRIVQLFEPAPLGVDVSDTARHAHAVYNTFFVSSMVLYGIAIATALILTVIVAIVRFYQGMYTNEGYLNHTLPVTPAQHIFAKLLNSLIFFIGTLFAIFLSFMVITLGEVNIEIFKAFGFLVGKFFSSAGAEGVLYIVEAGLLALISLITMYLKLYFCISVGQLAKKRKILLAFGAFFGIYVAKQIIGTIFIAMVAVGVNWITAIGEWFDHYASAVHFALWFGIVIYAIVAVVYFTLTRFIMGKKLNLT